MKVTLINEELSPHALKELEVRCWDDENEEAFRDAFDQFHYLKCPNGRQMLLKQVVLHQDRPVALLSWTHCCRALSERDNWVGWDRRTCSRRLPLVVQNNRFLLLTSAAGRTRNLASRVLALSVDHMAACWEEKFGHCVWLAETFVDPDRFNGTVIVTNGDVPLLTDLTDGSVATRGRATTVNSYNVVASDVATRAGERDSLEAGMRRLAEDIKLRLAIFLDRRESGAGTT